VWFIEVAPTTSLDAAANSASVTDRFDLSRRGRIIDAAYTSELTTRRHCSAYSAQQPCAWHPSSRLRRSTLWSPLRGLLQLAANIVWRAVGGRWTAQYRYLVCISSSSAIHVSAASVLKLPTECHGHSLSTQHNMTSTALKNSRILSQLLPSRELRYLPPPYGIARADHYIFILSFVLSVCLFSPNLSRRRWDVCHTSTYGVALVRI